MTPLHHVGQTHRARRSDSFHIPVHKGSFKLHDHSDPSTPISDILPIEDEETVKKKKKSVRKSLQLNSPFGLYKNRTPLKSALADFSENQKNDHYNFCMKLSSENKITAQNAFALHLIDYFSDVVKKETGDPNFQMASITLHASARLYSLRIDALHSDTIKMALSLHTDQNKKEVHEKKLPESDEVCDEDPKVPKGKKPKTAKRYVLPGAEKSMDVLISEMADEPHEKFHSVSEIFDGNRFAGLMSTCNVDSDNCKILLSEAYPFFCSRRAFLNNTETDDSLNDPTAETVRLLTEHLSSVTEDGISIAPSLVPFGFSNNEEEQFLHGLEEEFGRCSVQDNDVSKLTTSFDSVMKKLDEIQTRTENEQKSFDGCDSIYDEICSSPLLSNTPKMLTPKSGTPRGMSSTRKKQTPGTFTPRRKSSITGFSKLRVSGSAMKSFRNSYMLPPTPFPKGSVQHMIEPLFETGVDPLVDATLTGRSRMKKTKKIITTVKKHKRKHISFEKSIDKYKKKIHRGKRICFAANSRKLWSKSSTELGYVFDKKDLRKTFLAGLSLSELPKDEIASENRTTGYDHVHVASDDDDDDVEPYHPDDYDLCVSSLEKLHLDAKPSEADDSDHEIYVSALQDLHLVPEPEKVKKDMLFYSKSSKSIDQKRVKATIWNIISTYYSSECNQPEQSLEHCDTENVSVIESLEELQIEEQKLKFSVLYKKLYSSLPFSLQGKMSLSIAFVSLLHLANEKSLNIQGFENMKDLTIELDANDSSV